MYRVYQLTDEEKDKIVRCRWDGDTHYYDVFESQEECDEEQKRLDDNRMAESYFKLIIEELEILFVDKEEMSLREIEYLYKSYLLVADSCEKQFQSQYLNKAEECLRYIDYIIENPTRMDFTLKLYQSVEVKIAIALAMKERLRSSMWNCIQDEMREENNEKAEG